MRVNTKRILFVLPFLVLAACQFQRVKHSPTKAAADASPFLKALYFDENLPAALGLADERLRQSVTAVELKRLLTEIKEAKGDVKILRVDSYLMTPGQTMELFYVGTYEKGVFYHRLVMIGDASSGYRVSGIWCKQDPYPEDPLRRKFDGEVFVLQR